MLAYNLAEMIVYERFDELWMLRNCYASVGTSGILSYTKEVLPNFCKMF